MNAIEVTGLRKSFHRQTVWADIFRRSAPNVVLDGVDLAVRRGEIFGLLGPNGAGKTTLIKILCGLVSADAGEVHVDGLDVRRQSLAVRRRVGVVYGDERSFFWRLSVRENLRFYASLYGIEGVRRDRRIDQLLRLVGLADSTDVRMHAFSSGMKHRAAIARGLLHDPAVLVLDEPSRSLDPLGAAELHAIIREHVASDGRTVLVATHQMSEAEELCDRLTLIDHGSVVLTGTVGDFRDLIGSDLIYRMTVRGAGNGWVRGLRAIPGVSSAVVDGSSGVTTDVEIVMRDQSGALPMAIRHVVELGGEIESCTRQDLSLEEIFRLVVSGRRSRGLEATSA